MPFVRRDDVRRQTAEYYQKSHRTETACINGGQFYVRRQLYELSQLRYKALYRQRFSRLLPPRGDRKGGAF